MLTKAQYRTMVRQWLDDPNAKRWTDASIDLAIQFALDDLWTDILDDAPWMTSQLQTITSLHTPGGFIDLRQTAFGGDLTQRFYRAQLVKGAADAGSQAARIYYPKDPRDFLLTGGDASVIVATRFTYEIKGDQLWLYSSDMQFGPTPIDLRYSYKPTPFTQLTDSFNVQFPEGSEAAAILLAAANTMAKGNAEENAQLMNMAEMSRQRMLAAIRRQWLGSMQPYTTQSTHEFGGI